MKIAIASGKGGTGKTTVSTNLAHYLHTHQEVVLVDLDVEEPNSALFIHNSEVMNETEIFKHIPDWDSQKCTLCGLCQSYCNFNAIMKLGETVMIFPELCHSCFACSELCPENALPMKPVRMGEFRSYESGNLHFIEGKLDIGQEQAVPIIAQVIDEVDRKYSNDILKLYDSPPGTSCPVIEVTKESDFVMLVTEPTPFGLHDLKLAVETIREINKPFGVIINRADLGNDEVVKYCKQEGIDIIASIPNSRDIAVLYSEGKLIYPNHQGFREAIISIVEYLKKREGDIR